MIHSSIFLQFLLPVYESRLPIQLLNSSSLVRVSRECISFRNGLEKRLVLSVLVDGLFIHLTTFPSLFHQESMQGIRVFLIRQTNYGCASQKFVLDILIEKENRGDLFKLVVIFDENMTVKGVCSWTKATAGVGVGVGVGVSVRARADFISFASGNIYHLPYF